MPKTKTVKLENIKGIIFEDAEEAKMRMIENATRAIDGMVVKIQTNVTRYFGTQQKEVAKQNPAETVQSSAGELKSGYEWVTMEDGSRVQVKLPESMK
jgi:hypothetical protein